MRTTEKECLDALREAAERLGESPTKSEYEELNLTPASTTIRRVVGGWNEAKEKAGLERYEQGEYGGTDVRSKPADVEIPDGSEWEELTSQQRWYYQNQAHRIEVKESRRASLKRWFYELKRDEMECCECGEKRPPALDFHHRSEKQDDISAMVNDGYSKSRIKEEINRCMVLCTNCHRREHYEGPDPSTIPKQTSLRDAASDAPKHEARKLRRAWIVGHKRDSDGCEKCAVTDPICLDFHHEQDKKRTVAQMVSAGHSLPEIRDEITKCIMLCANCHRDLHFDPPSTDD